MGGTAVGGTLVGTAVAVDVMVAVTVGVTVLTEVESIPGRGQGSGKVNDDPINEDGIVSKMVSPFNPR